MQSLEYSVARTQMLPGDLLVFGGSGFISRKIMDVTKSNVSHVGVVLSSNITPDITLIQVIESMSLGSGKAGVKINRLSDHIREYNGNIWWLPLKDDLRENLDYNDFFGFMLQQVGKDYDAPQAIASAIDFLPDTREDLSRLFCSELVTAGYNNMCFVSENPSEQTPIDTCLFPLYKGKYQIKGILSELV